jgi:membrane protein DedA with SNARE-associated domain
MNSFDKFLVQYGLAAIFVIMLTKSAGVPIPIPGDVIILAAAARAAAGHCILHISYVHSR